MISYFLFGIFGVLYAISKLILRILLGDTRRSRRLAGTARQALVTLQHQHGGSTDFPRRHIFRYTLPDSSTVEIRGRRRPVISIHVPIALAHTLSIQRIPKLAFAFLESFFPQSSRIGNHPYLVTSDSQDLPARLTQRAEFNSLFERLAAEGYSAHMDGHGLRAWKRLSHRETSDVEIFGQIRLFRDFARACSGAIEMPVHAVSSFARCAYCREEISDAPDVIHCAACGTPHHQDCFALNGKCSVFGCNSLRPTEALQLAR